MIYPLNIQLFAEGGSEGGTEGDNKPGGDGSKTYTQEEVNKFVTEREQRAAKAALKDFYQKQGLTPEEVSQAINAFLDEKKKNSPEAQNSELKQQLSQAQTALAQERLKNAAEKAARKLGADDAAVDYVVKLADLSDVVTDGKISDDKLSEALKKVLDDVPAFKKKTGEKGVSKVGGDGGDQGGGDSSSDSIRKLFGLKPKNS